MINKDKWINSLPNANPKQNEELLQIDHNKWVDTIPKKSNYSSVKKYSFMLVVFVCGLFFVSVIKNQTRILEKEINYLKASISITEFNLKQATLDHEVITSPENIALLANEYLESDFIYYTKNQIKDLNNSDKKFTKLQSKKNLSDVAKKKIKDEINKKKQDLEKLKKIYSEPKQITKEAKTKLAEKIKTTQQELTFLYNEPSAVIKSEKAQRWAVFQVVKVFLGIPIVPGK